LGEDYNILNEPEILKCHAKILFLCSPNNPVGSLLDIKAIESIIQKFQGIVVIDEAYIEWTNQPSCSEWVVKYDHLIVLRTFSKIWGLAGIRCGVVIAHPSAIDTLQLSQTLFGFPDSSADLVSEKIKKFDVIFQYKEQMDIDRANLISFLSQLQFVDKIYPGAANFLLVKFTNEAKVAEHLFRAGILVSDASSLVCRSLRISIGTAEEMNRLKYCLEQLENSVLT
jgi:histidinol-phosphate aminotransferase